MTQVRDKEKIVYVVHTTIPPCVKASTACLVQPGCTQPCSARSKPSLPQAVRTSRLSRARCPAAGTDGLDLHRELDTLGIRLPVVFITGHGHVPMSGRAMRDGVIDFLTKPFGAMNCSMRSVAARGGTGRSGRTGPSSPPAFAL
jgi:hypothetical protein